MSAAEGLPAPLPSVGSGATEAPPDGLPSLCPYLATPDNWRSAIAVREHRCTAVAPPVQLAPEKQRRLCLVDGHVNCATYGAALAAHAASTRRLTGASRPIARMTPIILDHGRFDLRVPALRADRPPGQAVLVGVLGLALAAILLVRPAGDSGAAGPIGADASASTRASGAVVPPTVMPSDTGAPAETDGPASAPSSTPGSATPSSGASTQPATSGATYRVKSGDTLSAIAARFGTTTRVLTRLNGIADPSKLKVGQVLRLP